MRIDNNLTSSNDEFAKMVQDATPNLVTPHLSELVSKSSPAVLNEVATIIMKHMVEKFNNSDKARISRVVMVKGESREVRYLHFKKLYRSIWPAFSLALLNLPYGEQLTLIDSLYPKDLNFEAKAFAASFTNRDEDSHPLEVKTDPEIEVKLDSANAGIAMILAQLNLDGYRKASNDQIAKSLQDVQLLAKESQKKANYEAKLSRSKQAAKYKDRGEK